MSGRQKDLSGDVVRAWWQAIHQQQPESGERRFYYDRGHRARLRRSSTLDEVAQESSVWQLSNSLHLADDKSADARDTEALLLIAAALAEVKDDVADRRSLAGRLGIGAVGKDEKPAISELRFQRLMRSRDADELLQPLRRALRIGRSVADVAVLANDLLRWSWEHNATGVQAGRMKFDWARDYYLKRPDAALLPRASGAADATP